MGVAAVENGWKFERPVTNWYRFFQLRNLGADECSLSVKGRTVGCWLAKPLALLPLPQPVTRLVAKCQIPIRGVRVGHCWPINDERASRAGVFREY